MRDAHFNSPCKASVKSAMLMNPTSSAIVRQRSLSTSLRKFIPNFFRILSISVHERCLEIVYENHRNLMNVLGSNSPVFLVSATLSISLSSSKGRLQRQHLLIEYQSNVYKVRKWLKI